MAIGRIRAILIIALFAGSAAIPVLMETSIVPMINILDFIGEFVEIVDEELVIHYDALLNSVKKLEVLEESNENETIIQITLNVSQYIIYITC